MVLSFRFYKHFVSRGWGKFCFVIAIAGINCYMYKLIFKFVTLDID